MLLVIFWNTFQKYFFKILFSLKACISNTKEKWCHDKENCNGNTEACVKSLSLFCSPDVMQKLWGGQSFWNWKKKTPNHELKVEVFCFFLKKPSSSAMEGVFMARKPDSLKQILWKFNNSFSKELISFFFFDGAYWITVSNLVLSTCKKIETRLMAV